jgi:hypothetical protein
VRLREKANDILEDAGVAGLLEVEIAFAPGEEGSPEDKRCLCFTLLAQQGGYRPPSRPGGQVCPAHLPARRGVPSGGGGPAISPLQLAERAFRHIKSYLKLRPVFHYRRRRIRAHVLICFLGFYLVKRMELELRAAGETREVERLLRHWDDLCLVQHRLQVGEHVQQEWQWSLGENGQGIQAQIQALGWWHAIDAYRRRLGNTLTG